MPASEPVSSRASPCAIKHRSRRRRGAAGPRIGSGVTVERGTRAAGRSGLGKGSKARHSQPPSHRPRVGVQPRKSLRDEAPFAPRTRRCWTPDRVRGDDGRERIAGALKSSDTSFRDRPPKGTALPNLIQHPAAQVLARSSTVRAADAALLDAGSGAGMTVERGTRPASRSGLGKGWGARHSQPPSHRPRAGVQPAQVLARSSTVRAADAALLDAGSGAGMTVERGTRAAGRSGLGKGSKARHSQPPSHRPRAGVQPAQVLAR